MMLKPDECYLIAGMYFEFWPENRNKMLDFGVFAEIGKKLWVRRYSGMEEIAITKSVEKHLSLPDENSVFAAIVETIRETLNDLKTNNPTGLSQKTMGKLLSELS